jgi:hypothetical protein
VYSVKLRLPRKGSSPFSPWKEKVEINWRRVWPCFMRVQASLPESAWLLDTFAHFYPSSRHGYSLFGRVDAGSTGAMVIGHIHPWQINIVSALSPSRSKPAMQNLGSTSGEGGHCRSAAMDLLMQKLDIAMTLSLTRPYPDPTRCRVGSDPL